MYVSDFKISRYIWERKMKRRRKEGGTRGKEKEREKRDKEGNWDKDE